MERPFAKECLILERRKCSALLSRMQCLLCLIVTGCWLAADVLMKFDQLPIGSRCPYLCCCWCLGCLGMTSCGVDQDSDFKWQNWHKDIFLQLDLRRRRGIENLMDLLIRRRIIRQCGRSQLDRDRARRLGTSEAREVIRPPVAATPPNWSIFT